MPEVILSIRPGWCELIAQGIKKFDARKSVPKCDMPFKCYIYCTKDEPLYHSGEKFWCKAAGEFGNGKIIGEFICDQVVFLVVHPDLFAGHPLFYTKALEDACLTKERVEEYSGGKDVLGWHISDLVIYDQPKELCEFGIKRAPQSWCYVRRTT